MCEQRLTLDTCVFIAQVIVSVSSAEISFTEVSMSPRSRQVKHTAGAWEAITDGVSGLMKKPPGCVRQPQRQRNLLTLVDEIYFPGHCGSLKVLTSAPSPSGISTLQATEERQFGTCVMQFQVPRAEENPDTLEFSSCAGSFVRWAWVPGSALGREARQGSLIDAAWARQSV